MIPSQGPKKVLGEEIEETVGEQTDDAEEGTKVPTTITKANETKTAPRKTSTTTSKDVVSIGEKKTVPKTRPLEPLPAKPARLHNKNVMNLLPAIGNGDWLTDEQIDYAQALLARDWRPTTSVGIYF